VLSTPSSGRHPAAAHLAQATPSSARSTRRRSTSMSVIGAAALKLAPSLRPSPRRDSACLVPVTHTSHPATFTPSLVALREPPPPLPQAREAPPSSPVSIIRPASQAILRLSLSCIPLCPLPHPSASRRSLEAPAACLKCAVGRRATSFHYAITVREQR
jgi:hypothetical protein